MRGFLRGTAGGVVTRGMALALLAGCITLVSGEARQNGQFFLWRNELQTDANLQELVTAWVPSLDEPVKGFFFLGSHGGCPGADNRPWAMNDTIWHKFAAEFGFGCMATSHMCGYEYEMKNTNLLRLAIDEMAAAGNHPEIANVPLIPWGGSNSGATGYSLVNLMPEKILCGWLNVPAAFNPGTPTEGGLGVPAVWSTGENDFNRNSLPPIVANARGRGGLWAYVEVQGMGHEDFRVYHVARPFFEKCIEARYPKDFDVTTGLVPLKPIEETTGWLAMDDWRSGLIDVYSYADFPGDKSSAQWFIDEDVAFLARSLTNWNNVITVDMYVNDEQCQWVKNGDFLNPTVPGDMVRIVTNPNGFSWDRLELYNGATKIDEITSGTPEFTFPVEEGDFAQSFTVRAFDGSTESTDMPWNIHVFTDNSATVAQPAAVHHVGAVMATAAHRSFDLRGKLIDRSAAGMRHGVAVQQLTGGQARTVVGTY